MVKKLLQHEDLLDSQSLDLLFHLLEKDPTKRFGEKEIKEHSFFSIQFSTSAVTSGVSEAAATSGALETSGRVATSGASKNDKEDAIISPSYVGKLKYTSPAVTHHQPRHHHHRVRNHDPRNQRNPHDPLQQIDSSSSENYSTGAGGGTRGGGEPRTCLTLPSHDFENLSTSFSKYKPQEKPLDKVSDPLRKKRIQDFYSVDDDPLASTATASRARGGGGGGNHNNSSKAMDNSKGKLHLPQLPESKVESDDEKCELESFHDEY
jgi:hypothetical protein